MGLEPTPEDFVANLVEIFREVRRVLKPRGTFWLNIGDTYWGGKGKSGMKDAKLQGERTNSLNKAHHFCEEAASGIINHQQDNDLSQEIHNKKDNLHSILNH